jgi:hypothetical protein
MRRAQRSLALQGASVYLKRAGCTDSDCQIVVFKESFVLRKPFFNGKERSSQTLSKETKSLRNSLFACIRNGQDEQIRFFEGFGELFLR